jgi:LysR family transcriptional activator of nhaA
MSDLNYQHLRYFWAVAREGNLTRAAQRLHVTQSAVSVQIKKLEESLGHQLFERVGRRLVLSEAGRVALDYADNIFNIGDELVGALSDHADPVRRVLRVGVLATLSRNFQIAFLGPLLARDDVQLRVRSGAVSDLVQRLEAHQLDVVLSNFYPTRQESAIWVPHLIDEQPVSLIARPGYVRASGVKALLQSEPVVVPTTESGIRTRFDALAEQLGVKPRIIVEVDDMAMLRLVARSHHGISVLPPIVVRDELSTGSLVELERLPQLVEPFYAITVVRRIENELLRDVLAQTRSVASAKHAKAPKGGSSR